MCTKPWNQDGALTYVVCNEPSNDEVQQARRCGEVNGDSIQHLNVTLDRKEIQVLNGFMNDAPTEPPPEDYVYRTDSCVFVFDFKGSTYTQDSKIELTIESENYDLWEYEGPDWNQINNPIHTWPYYNASI